MNDISPNGDTFERLLKAMPDIAEAVNAFSSEENQRAALDALVRAMGVTGTAPTISPTLAEPPKSEGNGNDSAGRSTEGVDNKIETGPPSGPPVTGGTARTAGRRRRPAKKLEPVRDIDFRPEGKQSFKDLVEAKKPANIDQKNVLAVYWLEQVAEIPEIGVGHVMAAYKDRDWPEPTNPVNSLQATASRQHWIDTRNTKAIITTPGGRNQVKHEMPTATTDK